MDTHEKLLRFCSSFLLSLVFIFAPAQAMAQSIAVLKSRDLEPFNQALAGFVSACDDHITEYDLGGDKRKATDIIQRITATKPRLVLAVGALAAQIAKEGLPDIPVVFFMVPNPHEHGLEGNNIAGISLDIPIETQFTMYRSLVPSIKTIGVIYNPAKTGPMVAEAKATAAQLGLQLLAAPTASHKNVPAAMRSLLGKIDMLWMVPDDTVIQPESFQFLLLTAFENNLPFMTVSDIFVKVGALASLSPDYADVGRQGCQLVAEIERDHLKLAEVGVLPPTKVQLAINMKTADKIGVTLSSEIVQSASKVYR